MRAPNPPACSEEGLDDCGPIGDERLATIAKGLANPARVQILRQFRDCRPMMAHEVVAGTDLAQSTVSEHLRILRDADILFATKDGPRTWYCPRRSVVRRFAAAADDLAAQLVSCRADDLQIGAAS